MFRRSDPQGRFFGMENIWTEEKQKAVERRWAGVFREKAWPILLRIETEFTALFHASHGRPNRAVAVVMGVLILKEMFDLTDEEALEALSFDLLWMYALDAPSPELHLCQKTLHNFRAGLTGHEKEGLVFRRVTDELIEVLGVIVTRQRLDSTHILSNFVVLTRLGLFCETIRVFLHALGKEELVKYTTVPERILRRHGEESRYRDARKGDGPRRLGVVARDLYRLVVRFREDKAISGMESFQLMERLLSEQCEVSESVAVPNSDDDDHGEGAAPAIPKPPKEIRSDSLQTPHDPDATYSGHKGKGYEVQISETCVPENVVNLITHVEVTPSCGSDAQATVPIVSELSRAGHKPEELVADTTYGGGKNAAALSEQGVMLTTPAPAAAKPEKGQTYPAPTPACPTEARAATAWLQQREAQPEFRKRYAIRAGIEATNSECKRAHGMRKLRVRSGPRVRLAVYLKTAACNLKRALRHWLSRVASPPRSCVEAAACPA